MIEPEEMDFERLGTSKCGSSKGEKRVVQEGQKAINCALVEVSQENGVESRKELDAFVELDPVAEITEVGTKEVLQILHNQSHSHSHNRSHSRNRSQNHNRNQSHSHNHNRFRTQSAPHVSEGPEQTETSKLSVGVEPVSQKGIVSEGKEVEKTAQTPAVSAAPVSEGRLPNTGTEESVASLVAGILAAGLASAVLDDQKKEPIRLSKKAG